MFNDWASREVQKVYEYARLFTEDDQMDPPVRKSYARMETLLRATEVACLVTQQPELVERLKTGRAVPTPCGGIQTSWRGGDPGGYAEIWVPSSRRPVVLVTFGKVGAATSTYKGPDGLWLIPYVVEAFRWMEELRPDRNTND